MNLQRNKNTLLRNLGEDAVTLLTHTNAIIAGGALTSIFTGTEVNDYDIYFRSEKDIVTFLRNVYCTPGESSEPYPVSDDDMLDLGMFSFVCNNHTQRSITIMHNGLILQLIHFQFFKEVEDIFESFDFHMNMGAFDFSTNQFVLHDNFCTSIMAKRLTFNTGTRYPIMSTLRVSKYLERGYSISKKEMFKLGLSIADLNISTWDELEDQLSGFYGINVSDMFDRSIEFSIETAIDMMEHLVDIPESETLTNPSLDMLFFTVLGNPYKNQNIFFKLVFENTDGNLTDTHNTVTLELNSFVKVENLEVSTVYDNKESSYYFYGRRISSRIAVLQRTENTKMTYGHGGLELTGEVKLIDIKELE